MSFGDLETFVSVESVHKLLSFCKIVCVCGLCVCVCAQRGGGGPRDHVAGSYLREPAPQRHDQELRLQTARAPFTQSCA